MHFNLYTLTLHVLSFAVFFCIVYVFIYLSVYILFCVLYVFMFFDTFDWIDIMLTPAPRGILEVRHSRQILIRMMCYFIILMEECVNYIYIYLFQRVQHQKTILDVYCY